MMIDDFVKSPDSSTCAASLVIEAYCNKYASFLRICAPCLPAGRRTFYEVIWKLTFYESIMIKSDFFVISLFVCNLLMALKKNL